MAMSTGVAVRDYTNVRPLAAIFVLIGILAAHHAHAEDVSVQPLTRGECSGDSMTWDESANVCSGVRVSINAIDAMTKALEKAGVESTNGKRPGVRLVSKCQAPIGRRSRDSGRAGPRRGGWIEAR